MNSKKHLLIRTEFMFFGIILAKYLGKLEKNEMNKYKKKIVRLKYLSNKLSKTFENL